MNQSSCTLIVGITSGIGSALASHFESLKLNVVGTSRNTEIPTDNNFYIHPLDLASHDSIDKFVHLFSEKYRWNRLIFCPAVMAPIGKFDSIDIHEWLSTFNINFSNQVYLLHSILSFRIGDCPHVLFFAGGGTNSAPKNYSSYTLSKIALIKLVELLDEEIQDTSFTILGPGWVKTKIHEQSLEPSLSHLSSYQETVRRISDSDFVGMDKVIDSVMWILAQDKKTVGGRNFSTAHDPFDSDDFASKLVSDADVFKLRRHGNHLFQTNHIHS
ncbi:short chain dehydrogenase family protein [Synechococcus sp. PROS-9-1]|uniref:SDR family NAD(P)-dependent oxidoreductase n=1 Tax=Synechococcus sp. PROS-9-1 TaxID=1968775 RepID=UPI0016496DD6|nr:SDR family NAD(P)-dependent oxidoreductase [Synechococcus sp. PROS-9-1]QNJ30606.1 short chain dehydrogenase family protein [Synechococcus sp. PROS-9-1]